MCIYTKTLRGRARMLGLDMGELYQDRTKLKNGYARYLRIKVPIEQKDKLYELASFAKVFIPEPGRVKIYQPCYPMFVRSARTNYIGLSVRLPR